MRAGFGKADITPRTGIYLAGFGPFLNRHAIGVRDRLWARAMSVEAGGEKLFLVSCDLAGVNPSITGRAREMIEKKTGVPGDRVMICCTHTHSGPATDSSFGWGETDRPYVELLPYSIARACEAAEADMEDSVLKYGEAPCEGIGVNRVYDEDSPPLEQALRDDWRPAKPELTDTVCKVITVCAGEKLKGFISSFGCHPVTCCAQTRQIHGDYAGVATNNLERENPGSVGLFLQGASGDVNSCVVHKPEKESLLALDIVAARFANSVREGIGRARPVEINSAKAISREVCFSRKKFAVDELRSKLVEYEKLLENKNIGEADHELRMAVLNIHALRKFIGLLTAGREAELTPLLELQVFKIGPITLFGAPLEIFQGIKNELISKTESATPVVVSLANASFGYAPSNDRIGAGEYADSIVPIIKQSLPFTDIHNELVFNFLDMEKCL